MLSLVENLKEHLETDNAHPQNTPLLTVLRGQETLHVSSRGVFDGISNRELKVRGWDDTRSGIAAAMFNNREVDRFLQLLHDRELGDAEGLTTLRVSHIFSMNPMTVYTLLQNGLLKPGPQWTKKRPRISRSSVERFQAHYVTAAELGRAFGTNALRISSTLAEMGVSPILRDRSSKFDILVFKRSSIDLVGLSKKIRHGKARQPNEDRDCPFLLSDHQMDMLDTILPPPHSKPRNDDRIVISGIIYAIINNFKWPDIPLIYGRSSALNRRLTIWGKDGTFDEILKVLSTQGPKEERIKITPALLNRFFTTSKLLKAGFLPSFSMK